MQVYWQNQLPLQYLSIAIKILGAPSYVNPNAGGMAVWNNDILVNRGFVFSRVELHDEDVLQVIPYPHSGFLYYWVNYDLNDILYDDVLTMSGALQYDPIRKWLRARADCHEHCIGLLNLAMHVGEQKYSKSYAEDYELLKGYFMSISDPEKWKLLQKQFLDILGNQRGCPVSYGYWRPETRGLKCDSLWRWENMLKI